MSGFSTFPLHQFYPGQRPHGLTMPATLDVLEVMRGLRKLGEESDNDTSIRQFTDLLHLGSGHHPSNEAFVDVVRRCLQAGRSELCKMFMMVSLNKLYLCDSQVVGELVDAVCASCYHHVLGVICDYTEPEVALDKKLRAVWITKRFDLLDACLATDRYDIPRKVLFRLSLETAEIILEWALEGSDTDTRILDCVMRVARVTDFLKCVFNLGRHEEPPVKKLVDHFFLNTNVRTLLPEQSKLLWMSSKAEVVLAWLFLQTTLKGQVCPLPRSLELLGSMDEAFRVLDTEFLAPLFSSSTSGLLQCPPELKAATVRDVVILLVRSGLLHQLGAWLEGHLEQCEDSACSTNQYCQPSNYIVSPMVHDCHTVQLLLLESGFLPHKLLMGMMPREEQAKPQQQQEQASSGSHPGRVRLNVQVLDPGSDVYPGLDESTTMDPNPPSDPEEDQQEEPVAVDLLKDPIHRREKTLEVVSQFIEQPYSLRTQLAAQISTHIGCHSGRTERINALPLPNALKDRVAFKGEHLFRLSCEMEPEEREKLMEAMKSDPFNFWLRGYQFDYEAYHHLLSDEDDDFLNNDDDDDDDGNNNDDDDDDDDDYFELVVGNHGDAPPLLLDDDVDADADDEDGGDEEGDGYDDGYDGAAAAADGDDDGNDKAAHDEDVDDGDDKAPNDEDGSGEDGKIDEANEEACLDLSPRAAKIPKHSEVKEEEEEEEEEEKQE